MEQTTRLGLPLLNAGQVQKELWHNEALLALDCIAFGVIDPDVASEPPPNPIDHRWYRVGASATGEWSGKDGQLTVSTAGGWRYLQPFEGLSLREAGTGKTWSFNDGQWSSGIVSASVLTVDGVPVVGARQGPIADPDGGSVNDAEVRETIREILLAMRTHGLIG